jgi:hypothetical protein
MKLIAKLFCTVACAALVVSTFTPASAAPKMASHKMGGMNMASHKMGHKMGHKKMMSHKMGHKKMMGHKMAGMKMGAKKPM